VTRGWNVRVVRRGVLAAVLVAAAFAPTEASSSPASCTSSCTTAGSILWQRSLPGSWTAASAVMGTVPAGVPDNGQAYADAGLWVAAIGYGLVVRGYNARTGRPLWTVHLHGFPSGDQIVSVRVWSGVITVGVAEVPLMAVSSITQSTVVLSAWSGIQRRSYPAAPFGGAVSADAQHTVVVGPDAVTSYDNATGRKRWSVRTGSAEQNWRVDGGHLYIAEAAGGSLGAKPAVALRRINLATGAAQVIFPSTGSFAGQLSAVLRQVVLFSGAQGTTAYDATTGQELWSKPGAVTDSVDVVQGLFYLTLGSELIGVTPVHGRVVARITGADGPGAAGVYGVRNGIALGLDQGQLGDAWGYDVSSQHVVWNTGMLPWPHYFVDLSGIGGSTSPGSDTVILTTCLQRVQVSGGRVVCRSPKLVLIER
jgi:outer membrane protein assembly factor BamB